MNSIRIEYLIRTPKGEVLEWFKNYSPTDAPFKNVSGGNFSGFVKITIGNEIITRMRDEIIVRFKEQTLSQIADEQVLNFVRGTGDDYVAGEINEFVERKLDACIKVLTGEQKKGQFGMMESQTYLTIQFADNNNVSLSFCCSVIIIDILEEPAFQKKPVRENRDNIILPAEDFFQEVIRSTEEFLKQLLQINNRLEEWEYFVKLKNKLQELKNEWEVWIYTVKTP